MHLKIYKPGQGYYTRLYSGLVAFAIAAIGCFRLYQELVVWTDNPWVWTFVPIGLCSVLGFFVFWMVNRPAVADFMIAAEGELKKVSWSSRGEIMVSTAVVICVVILLAVMLLLADVLFQYIFGGLVGLY